MPEALRSSSGGPSLAELTGQQLDLATFSARLSLSLEVRRMSLEDYARRELAIHAETAAKIAKFGARTPVAPYLPEVRERLERAVYMSGDSPISDAELIELLAHHSFGVEEARDYYDD